MLEGVADHSGSIDPPRLPIVQHACNDPEGRLFRQQLSFTATTRMAAWSGKSWSLGRTADSDDQKYSVLAGLTPCDGERGEPIYRPFPASSSGQDEGMDHSIWTSRVLEEEVSWLRERSEYDNLSGFDATGWEANIWVLHCIYESSVLDSALTHDDIHRSDLEAGLVEPTVIGDCNLDDEAVLTGGGLGFSGHPGSSWSRLRWTDLAVRMNLRFEEQKVPPCFRWFPYRSWPISICPPAEGSLDSENLDRLIAHLTGGSSSVTCVAAHSFLSGGCDDRRPRCFSGPVARLRDFVDGGEWAGTPSNFWAPDRSWMVYSDWDLWATKVSGSAELIQSLRADPDLETSSWPSH
jgi:hypothetical protein